MLQHDSESGQVPGAEATSAWLAHPGGRAPRSFELLPAIDLRGGQVVRLSEGDFSRETVYGSDPAAVAEAFAEAGARWIHIVDLDGARDGQRRQTQTVERIVAAVGERVACEVAGGLRDEDAVERALAAGAARVVVGTAALREPDLVGRLVTRFGAGQIAIALDVREGLAVGHGWAPGTPGLAAAHVLADLADRGARTFVVTAIARDGLLSGPDLELLRAMVEQARGDVIASAGVTTLEDIQAVREIGCTGAVIGRAIYEGRLDLAAAIRLVSSAEPESDRS
jgi:phosphoribosylformimino-5-aminoimidazole carboxamide ribotide isomerase